MNINEAYVKGLDDAENNAISKISKALIFEDDVPFNNPKMEELRQTILKLKPEVEFKDVNSVDTSSFVLNMIEGIILDRGYIQPRALTVKERKVIDVFESLMNHFKALSNKKTNVGKAFAKILKDKQSLLTSEESLLN